MRREVAEETALTVTVSALAGVVERPAQSGVYAIHDYLCEPVGGTATAGSDASDIRWVNAREFAELDRSGALVDLLAETLREWGAGPTC